MNNNLWWTIRCLYLRTRLNGALRSRRDHAPPDVATLAAHAS